MEEGLRQQIVGRSFVENGERVDSLHGCRAINELLSVGLISGTPYARIVGWDLLHLKPIRSIAPIGAIMNIQNVMEC